MFAGILPVLFLGHSILLGIRQRRSRYHQKLLDLLASQDPEKACGDFIDMLEEDRKEALRPFRVQLAELGKESQVLRETQSRLAAGIENCTRYFAATVREEAPELSGVAVACYVRAAMLQGFSPMCDCLWRENPEANPLNKYRIVWPKEKA